jgi:alpha/beta superfamily hydrolase
MFEPVVRVAEQLPCVVYMHGNCSSRMEALACIRVLLSQNIQLFAFDFPGCGLSEGEFISLGYFEKEDLSIVVEYLRNSGKVSTIGLWGRSMGAVTALLHGHRDPSIAGMVLDSPFSDLKDLAHELAKKHTKIPGFILSGAIKLVRNTIKKKAHFDIQELSPIKHVENCFIPALFGVGMQDDFIDPAHSQKIHAKYAGDKNLIQFDGDHNSERPPFFFDSAAIFFFNTLQCADLPQVDTKQQP